MGREMTRPTTAENLPVRSREQETLSVPECDRLPIPAIALLANSVDRMDPVAKVFKQLINYGPAERQTCD